MAYTIEELNELYELYGVTPEAVAAKKAKRKPFVIPEPVLTESSYEYDKPWTSDVYETGRQVVAGAMVDLPKMIGQAAQAFSPETSFVDRFGKYLERSAEKRAKDWTPDMEGRGKFAEAFISGGRSIAPSIATMGGAMAASAAAPFIGAGGALALGAVPTLGLFGGSQYQETYDKMKAAGKSDKEAHEAGLKVGVIHGLGETAANVAGVKLLGAGRNVLKGGVKEALGKATEKQVLKPFAKAYGTSLIVEPATEIAQDVSTEAVHRGYGLKKTQDYGDIAYQSGTAAMAMSTLLAPFGIRGHIKNARFAEQAENALENPELDATQRNNIVDRLANTAKYMGVKKDEVETWQQQAHAEIAENKPITRFVKPESGEVAQETTQVQEPLQTDATSEAQVQEPQPFTVSDAQKQELINKAGKVSPQYAQQVAESFDPYVKTTDDLQELIEGIGFLIKRKQIEDNAELIGGTRKDELLGQLNSDQITYENIDAILADTENYLAVKAQTEATNVEDDITIGVDSQGNSVSKKLKSELDEAATKYPGGISEALNETIEEVSEAVTEEDIAKTQLAEDLKSNDDRVRKRALAQQELENATNEFNELKRADEIIRSGVDAETIKTQLYTELGYSNIKSDAYIKAAQRGVLTESVQNKLDTLQDNLIKANNAITERDSASAIQDQTPSSAFTNLDAEIHAKTPTSPLNEMPTPTQEQQQAGDYDKGRVEISGLKLNIENPFGTVRSGINEQGEAWSTELKDSYGEIEGSKGVDGDPIDIFIRPGLSREQAEAVDKVFVVDQINPATGEMDEHKVVMGYDNYADAVKAYNSNYEPGWQGLGAITEVSMPEFQQWLVEGNTQVAVNPTVRNKGINPYTQIISEFAQEQLTPEQVSVIAELFNANPNIEFNKKGQSDFNNQVHKIAPKLPNRVKRQIYNALTAQSNNFVPKIDDIVAPPKAPDVETFVEQPKIPEEEIAVKKTAKISVDNAVAQLRDSFGPGIDALIQTGVLNLTYGRANWPQEVQQQIPENASPEAVYFNRKAHVDLNVVGADRLNQVVLHELGEHFNLRRMIGSKAYTDLQNQITNRAKIEGSEARKVWNQVKKLYKKEQEGSERFIAEVIAKLGENNPKAPWYRRLLSKVKSFMLERGLARGFVNGTLTENDLHELLRSSLQSAIRAANPETRNQSSIFDRLGSVLGASKSDDAAFSVVESAKKDGYKGEERQEAQAQFSIQPDPTEEQIYVNEANKKQKEWLDGVRNSFENKLDAIDKGRLAVLNVRQLVEVGRNVLPQMADYAHTIQEMISFRSRVSHTSTRYVDALKRLRRKSAKSLQRLYDGVNESTSFDIDAARDWVGVYKKEAFSPEGFESTEESRRLDELQGVTRKEMEPHFVVYTQDKLSPAQRAALDALLNDPNIGWATTQDVPVSIKGGEVTFRNEADANQFLPVFEKWLNENVSGIYYDSNGNQQSMRSADNKTRYDAFHDTKDEAGNVTKYGLRSKFKSWDGDAKFAYSGMNRMYQELFLMKVQELENRMRNSSMASNAKAEAIAAMRKQFESSMMQFYYAPLARFGKYWVYGKDSTTGETIFEAYTNNRERERAAKAFVEKHGANNLWGTGLSGENLRQAAEAGISDKFILEMQSAVRAKGLDREAENALLDDIYQAYLETLPDISIRKQSKHRNVENGIIKGYEQDVRRVFARTIPRWANQLSGIKYNPALAKLLEEHHLAVDAAMNTLKMHEVELNLAAAQKLQELLNNAYLNLDIDDIQNMLEADKDATKLDSVVYDMAKPFNDRLALVANNDLTVNKYAKIKDRADIILSHPKGGEKAAIFARQLLGELDKNYQAVTNTATTDLDNFAELFTQASYQYMISFGVSTALFNSLQTGIVAAAHLEGRNKRLDVQRELIRATKEYIQAAINKETDKYGKTSLIPKLRRDAKAKYFKNPNGTVDYTKDNQGNPIDPNDISVEDGLLIAMLRYGDEGDLELTQAHALHNEGEMVADDGSLMNQAAIYGGAMMHSVEQMNRIVTLAAAYRLARTEGIKNPDGSVKPPMSHQQAFEYARQITFDAHGDYNKVVAPRLFRGPLARIAFQYQKYPQMMYANLGIQLQTMLSKIEDPAKRQEAARKFTGVMVRQLLAAGAMGLPLMGMLLGAIDLAMTPISLANGDDEPWDTEKEVHLALVEAVGPRNAEWVMKGTLNAWTDVNASSRLDLADMFFREPLIDKEGRELAEYYMMKTWGPTGGLIANVADGIKLMSEGETQRGVEKLTPKAIADIFKAIRYSKEGATTLKGDKLKDMSHGEVLLQAIGISSSDLSRTYQERSYVKSEEQHLMNARSKVMQEAAAAQMAREPFPIMKIREWNRNHPEYPITAQNIKQSIRAKARSEANREGSGYVVNPKLEYLRDKNRVTY